jgi:catechol 2,3-dioxygenase-like lactoylglutathione lyase family enzyme
MQRFAPAVVGLPVLLAVFAGPLSAQSETMMYDHVHLAVPDPPTAAAWYGTHFGGEEVDGRDERRLIGTTRFIFRQEANPRPSEGGAVDHLGFSVMDLDAKLRELEADGARITTPRRDVEGLFPLAFVTDPWGVRLEIVQDPQHLGFHHIHLRSPDPEATLQAYMGLFGGVRTPMRGRLDGIYYPGNVWVLVTRGEGVPTVGTTIDHLGWRASHADTKLAELRGEGTTISREPNELTFENGTIRFFFIDGPYGVNIEIVQRAPTMR